MYPKKYVRFRSAILIQCCTYIIAFFLKIFVKLELIIVCSNFTKKNCLPERHLHQHNLWIALHNLNKTAKNGMAVVNILLCLTMGNLRYELFIYSDIIFGDTSISSSRISLSTHQAIMVCKKRQCNMMITKLFDKNPIFFVELNSEIKYYHFLGRNVFYTQHYQELFALFLGNFSALFECSKILIIIYIPSSLKASKSCPVQTSIQESKIISAVPCDIK